MRNSRKISKNLAKYATKNINVDENFEIRDWCKGVHRVDLGESFPTHILMQNLASIQPRTSRLKFLTQGERRFLTYGETYVQKKLPNPGCYFREPTVACYLECRCDGGVAKVFCRRTSAWCGSPDSGDKVDSDSTPDVRLHQLHQFIAVEEM